MSAPRNRRLPAAQQLPILNNRPLCSLRKSALLFGTALSVAAGFGYGRGAYAQTVLSGAQTDTQALTGPGEFVTDNTFSVDTSAGTGDAITITTDSAEVGNTTFTDENASSIEGAESGIYADNDGSGELSITTTGAVTAGDDGIDTDQSGDGDQIVTVNGNITAADEAINVDHHGKGLFSITVNGDLTSVDEGIDVDRDDEDGPAEGAITLIVNGNVTSDDEAIHVDHEGDGLVDIDVTGDLVAEDVGIEVDHFGTGNVFITTSGEVKTEDDEGIDVNHEGAGNVAITAGGFVRSGDHGITVVAESQTNGVTVIATDITADPDDSTNGDGINVDNKGSGALVIEVSGSIVAGDDGIFADNITSSTGDLRITANNIETLDDTGITARNSGDGVTRITTTGEIDSFNTGILADEHSGSGDIVVKARGVIGSRDAEGIKVIRTGSGNAQISANNATGATTGIYADNDGSGALSITANGAVTGGTGDGIYADNASTEDLTITIAEGGSVSTSGTDTASDFAIEAIANNGAVIVNNLGTVTGRVNLTNSNTFTNTGTWDLAETTSNFNATGDSTVENSGLIIAAEDPTANEVSAIDNLDTFRNNAGGIIRLADGAAGDTFSLGGSSGDQSFVANGGSIELDIELGDNSASVDTPSIGGDLRLQDSPTALMIDTVSTATNGNPVGQVQVVTVGGTSEAGAFTLGQAVEVGAFAYELRTGECADSTASPNNWYLCYTDEPGPAAAVFESLPNVLLSTFARAESLQQRMASRFGESEEVDGSIIPQDNGEGFWVRSWGDYATATPDTSSAGAELDSDSYGLQFGLSHLLSRTDAGDLVGSGSVRYARTRTAVENSAGGGVVKAEGHGLGLGLTYYADSGFYADLNAAADSVRTDARSEGAGELLTNYDDVVYSLSAEIGERIVLDDQLAVVPQMQLSLGQIDESTLEDNLGNAVELKERSQLIGRVGLAVERLVTDTPYGSGKVYAFGNLLHDLSDEREVSYAGADLTQSNAGTYGQFGGGFSLMASQSTHFYGQIAYREAFDEVDGQAHSISVGWRTQF